MTIEKKIVVSTTVMVFLTVLLTMAAVLTLLNQEIELQTRELIEELSSQSNQRINMGKKVLNTILEEHIQRIQYVTGNTCRDDALREPLKNGQWKALSAFSANVCMNADIDFMVIFDTKGRVVTSYPAPMDEAYPEAHFKELGLFNSNSFATAISKKDLTAVAVVSSFEKWNHKIQKGYNITGNDAGDIVVVSAGMIPNEFFDEPLGCVLTGIKSNRLSVPFHHFFKTTGQVCLLTDRNNPLVWAGVSGDNRNIEGLFHAVDGDFIKIKPRILDGKKYQSLDASLLDFFPTQGSIRVAREAARFRIIIGEPAALIDNARDKVITEGARIRNTILMTTLLIALTVLALTVVIMGLIARKIARPIALAAQMSNKIASGDLTHVLDEASSDETAILSTSMNLMVENLKTFEKTNKRQMTALKESENKFRTFFNTSHQAIALLEMETGRFIDANAKLCETSKYKKNKIIGKTAAQLGFFSQEDEVRFTGLAQTGSINGTEMAFKTKDGSVLNIQLYAAPIQINDKAFFLTEFYDITEQKHLESQLKQSLKMESIGTLAGGIAHDFNNLLAIIIGNLELALDIVPKWNPAYQNLKAIESSGKRAAEIVKQILNFSRKSDQDLKPTRIIPVLKDSFEFIRSTIPATIDIQWDIRAQDRPILADPVQMNQILLNLCINASQEMAAEGGNLELLVEDETVSRVSVGNYPELSIGDHIKISVGDTGPGIKPTIIDKIFDPYFTTKKIGEGSGMGLAVVHGIVKNHGGAIRVNNRPGNGAMFTLFFPVITQRPELPARESNEIPRGNETILFVDDEKFIVTMTKRILEQLSYKVEGKTNPVEALELFQSDPRQFDLVISDMTMPQMTGLKLLEQIKTLRPDIPVIICTGYSPLIDEEQTKKMGVTAYLMKPIVIKNMATTVRKVLDEAKSLVQSS